MIPGEYVLRSEEIEINKGKEPVTVSISNTGDRPVQVGSHFHFFEVNRELVFDRGRAFGMRLDIPAGTAVRFEPGQDKEVRLVPFGGRRAVYGLNALTNGAMDEEPVKDAALQKARDKGFGGA
jgi:urease beta subunit